jgi:hypothetical protein
MADYSDDIETAQELIEEFGQQCFWQKQAPVIDDSVPGYPVVGELPEPIPVMIAFFSGRDLSRGAFGFMDMMPNMEVADNAEVGLMAGGLSFTPENTDTVRRGAADAPECSIQPIDRLAPDGTPILYYVTIAA